MITRLALAAAAVLAACAPTTPTSEPAPWRLQHLYGPGREPHEPFRFWLSAPDLAAAAGDRSPRLRSLMLNPDGGWTIITTEYRCDENLVRRIEARGFNAVGRQTHRDAYHDAPSPLSPVTPEAVAYRIVCDGAAGGDIEVATIAAAAIAQAGDHARYLATAPTGVRAPVRPATPPA